MRSPCASIAIGRNPKYIGQLRSCLDTHGDPSTLEIMSVSSVIKMLRNGKFLNPRAPIRS